MYLLLTSPFPFLLSASAFLIHLGLNASCLQPPIFGIIDRTPSNPFPPVRQAGKRAVTEFGGNAFVFTLVSGNNLSSEIKNVIQRSLSLLIWAGRLYRTGVALEFAMIRKILPKTLTTGFKHIRESYHSCVIP